MKKTYLFLIDHENEFLGEKEKVLGAATRVGESKGDMALIFKRGLLSPFTYVHECAHTLGLDHTFVGDINKDIIFYQGYTDNYEDYDGGVMGRNKNFKENSGSFFFWQWDVLRKDRSIK